MAKRSSKSNSNNLLTGIFGNLHFGSIVKCDNDDDGLFCTISKLFNGFIMIIIFIAILFILYKYIAPMVISNKKRRR